MVWMACLVVFNYDEFECNLNTIVCQTMPNVKVL